MGKAVLRADASGWGFAVLVFAPCSLIFGVVTCFAATFPCIVVHVLTCVHDVKFTCHFGLKFFTPTRSSGRLKANLHLFPSAVQTFLTMRPKSPCGSTSIRKNKSGFVQGTH